jgi:hypothetical protein
LTRLAEAGQPDWVIQAQIGHVSPAMMKTYSHVRRLALDEAAAVLKPTFDFVRAETKTPTQPIDLPAPAEAVTSQVTSQSDDLDAELNEIVRKLARRTGRFPQLVDPRSSVHGLLLTGSPRFRESSRPPQPSSALRASQTPEDYRRRVAAHVVVLRPA